MSNYFRTMETIALQLPKLPRPAFWEIKKLFPYVKKVELDTSVVERSALELGTVLLEGELKINGAEYERRLGADPYFGFQQGFWLVKHQDEDKYSDFKALAKKGFYIYLPGLKVVGADDEYGFSYLESDSKYWSLHLDWIGDGLDRFGRIARPRK